MSLKIFRVTVRGRFADLDEATRARLLDQLAEHDVVAHGRFSEAGTLVYERSLHSWTFRTQRRAEGEDAEAVALGDAVEQAEVALAELGAGHRDVRASAIDMASMWERTGGGPRGPSPGHPAGGGEASRRRRSWRGAGRRPRLT
jgi:hypothetical protein